MDTYAVLLPATVDSKITVNWWGLFFIATRFKYKGIFLLCLIKWLVVERFRTLCIYFSAGKRCKHVIMSSACHRGRLDL